MRDFQKEMSDLARELLLEAYEKSRGSVSGAARYLQVPQTQIYHLTKKHAPEYTFKWEFQDPVLRWAKENNLTEYEVAKYKSEKKGVGFA